MTVVWELLMYAGVLAFVALMNKREFLRSPEKGKRYAALPLLYKLGCWCGVIPLVVAMFFVHQAFFLAVVVSYAALQGACVRWYRKNGHLP